MGWGVGTCKALREPLETAESYILSFGPMALEQGSGNTGVRGLRVEVHRANDSRPSVENPNVAYYCSLLAV